MRLAILSHVEHYDEIIACYNGCTDNTEQILFDLAEQYPHKIKVHHYLPQVYPGGSVEYAGKPDGWVHGLANYYNYALSKTTYDVATKLDADHLAIPHKLAPLLETIRKDRRAGKQKIYLFSGINLARDENSAIGILENDVFSGTTTSTTIRSMKIAFIAIQMDGTHSTKPIGTRWKPNIWASCISIYTA